MISIIFGFANEEVQNVLRTHWKRKMMVRMVKREGRQRSKRKFGNGIKVYTWSIRQDLTF